MPLRKERTVSLLMNVVFSTVIGGSSVATTSFETYDDLGCETTAKLLLGTGANLNQGKWYIKSGLNERTVICFPKQGEYKPEVNRGPQQ